jgi:hypothetical protein
LSWHNSYSHKLQVNLNRSLQPSGAEILHEGLAFRLDKLYYAMAVIRAPRKACDDQLQIGNSKSRCATQYYLFSEAAALCMAWLRPPDQYDVGGSGLTALLTAVVLSEVGRVSTVRWEARPIMLDLFHSGVGKNQPVRALSKLVTGHGSGRLGRNNEQLLVVAYSEKEAD